MLVLGNPGNRRLEAFRQAAGRAGLPPPRVLAWRDFLAAPARLGEALATARELRIESPGEDFAVTRALLARGAEEPDPDEQPARLSRAACLALEEDRGRVLCPRQEFLGLKAALREVGEALAATGVRAWSAPEEVLVMGDKPRCQARLGSGGVPVPEVLGTVRGFEQLRQCMATRGVDQVFVKLRNGSSASGVLAYRSDGRRHRATSSLEVVGTGRGLRLYNSLKLRSTTDEGAIAALVDALGPEGLHVERWVPKAGLQGRTFDLRVVVIGGRARHVVVRTSRGPLTNLHLGNRRGDAGVVLRWLGEGPWQRALATCEAAMGCFPGSHYGGVDLLLSPRGAPRVAEVNAWGDLLPGVLWQGRDTYEEELHAPRSAA